MMATVHLTLEGPIATILVDRPDKLNALTVEMLEQLDAHCGTLERSADVRVVLLKTAGERAFCVGADILAWSDLSPIAFWREWIRLGHRIFERLASLPQPVIAVLDGYTLGGGLELALAADIRLAAENVQLALPEVKLGIIPGWAGTQRLPALIGAARAKQMIFSGERISAQKAETWGLVNEVLAPESLAKRAQELADAIAQNGPLAVQFAKQTIDAGLGQNPAFSLEALASGLAAFTEDAKEGQASFREKREAHFKGQ